MVHQLKEGSLYPLTDWRLWLVAGALGVLLVAIAGVGWFLLLVALVHVTAVVSMVWPLRAVTLFSIMQIGLTIITLLLFAFTAAAFKTGNSSLYTILTN